MALESATWISELDESNPVAGDPKSQGDDHLRLIKHVLLSTFPDVNGVVTASDEELSYCNGVTSAIQTQLNTLDTEKADLESPALTGTPSAPTAETGTTGNQIATLDFVIATALSASLPGQTGNAGKFISTDGTNGFWEDTMDVSVVHPSVGTDFATTTGTQTLENKTIEDPIFCDGVADATKRLAWNLTNVATATERAVTVYDEDVDLFTPGRRLLATVTASNSATVDIENAFSTYDLYIIEVYDVVCSLNSQDLQVRFKKGGSYLTGNVYNYRSGADSVLTAVPAIVVDANISNTGGNQFYCEATLVRPQDTAKVSLITFKGGNTFGTTRPSSLGACTTTGAIQGVRFFMSSGNISTGTFKLYGVRKT